MQFVSFDWLSHHGILKHLHDWSRGKQLILFPKNLNVYRGRDITIAIILLLNQKSLRLVQLHSVAFFFLQNKVSTLIFIKGSVAIFNKTIISLALVAYEMIIANSAHLPSHIQRALME